MHRPVLRQSRKDADLQILAKTRLFLLNPYKHWLNATGNSKSSIVDRELCGCFEILYGCKETKQVYFAVL